MLSAFKSLSNPAKKACNMFYLKIFPVGVITKIMCKTLVEVPVLVERMPTTWEITFLMVMHILCCLCKNVMLKLKSEHYVYRLKVAKCCMLEAASFRRTNSNYRKGWIKVSTCSSSANDRLLFLLFPAFLVTLLTNVKKPCFTYFTDTLVGLNSVQ